jgi:toxin-antitoxin system PIN domain toxin
MTVTDRVLLTDVNVLVALLDESHTDHGKVLAWFDQGDHRLALCPLTEAGFLRLMSNPTVGGLTVAEAQRSLQSFRARSDCQFWEIKEEWVTLTGAFMNRVYGHRQIMDSYLLGLAIRNSGILVTMDKGILQMAGQKYHENVLLL